MFGAESTINELPEEFGRQDVLKKVLSQGYSLGRADQLLNYCTLMGLVERMGRGRYRRVNSNERIARQLHEQGLSYRQIAERLNISKSLVGKYINEDGQ